jgi:hypothetical protein
MKKQNQNLSPAERNAIQMADAVFGALSKPPMSPVTSMPPDPDEKNMERAEWAHRAILAFESATGTDREDALADLLGDLMHWSNVYGQDFDRELDSARRHYASETATEPGWEELATPDEFVKWAQSIARAAVSSVLPSDRQPAAILPVEIVDPDGECPSCGATEEGHYTTCPYATLTINPSHVAAMADKLGTIL